MQTNIKELNEELNRLLGELEPDNTSIVELIRKVDSISGEKILVTLNEEKLLNIVVSGQQQQKYQFPLQNDGSVLPKTDYDSIREAFMNRGNLKKFSNDKFQKRIINFVISKVNKQEIQLNDTLKEKLDLLFFLEEFREFINCLPEIPEALENYINTLKEINAEDIDIDEQNVNDPALLELRQAHKNMLSFLEDSYKEKGNAYIQHREEFKNQSVNENQDKSNENRIDDLINKSYSSFLQKYPVPGQKVERLFKLLVEIKDAENITETIGIVADRLGLNKNKLQQYFKLKEGKIEPIEEADIPFSEKYQLPISKREQKEPGVRTLDEIIDELVFFKDDVVSESDNPQGSQNQKTFEVQEASETKLKNQEPRIPINIEDEIKAFCKKIDDFYNRDFKNKDVNAIHSWFKEKRKTGLLKDDFEDICEAIAAMDRANELVTGGHRLRESQKAAILTFMQSHDKGHIGQINTGEGKTTIIAFVQALKVLQGYKGQVITSNGVLAADGVKNKETFYQLLSMTVAHNNPDNSSSRPRVCYSKDIVYGSINNFQFDWLRHSFEGLNILGKDYDFKNIWVMLDEIDSLLIDQGGNIAKLSGPFPGMESLRYVYIKIWAALIEADKEAADIMQEKLAKKQAQLKQSKVLEGAFNGETEKLLEEYESFQNAEAEAYFDNIKKIMKNKVEPFLDDKANQNAVDKKKMELQSIAKTEDEKDRKIIEEKIKAEIAKLERDRKDFKEILPSHLIAYVKKNLDRWLESALAANYKYQENVEYKIINMERGRQVIIPVDNQNTGTSMQNTILSHGLHQFLQLKHGLELTYESLTSSFVSNLGYIRKYGHKLSGVTGTLGSEPERRLLASVFNVAFSQIPTYKPKHFTQVPGNVFSDEEFLQKVAFAALSETLRQSEEREEKPRSVLIVCASIRDAEELKEIIKSEAKLAGLAPKLRVYTDESEAYITEETVGPNEIIIATNIAGRGTDLQTTVLLEENGGLHVIAAFLPYNKRVEDQALGRTARQGNLGTGQILIRTSEVEAIGLDPETVDFKTIINKRDRLEQERINDIRDRKIFELCFQDTLFEYFSKMYIELIKLTEHGKENETYDDQLDLTKRHYLGRDLKEKWAFWLEEQAYTPEKIMALGKDYKIQAESEFKKFTSQPDVQSILGGTIRHNPYNGICLAERYLEANTTEDIRKAKTELDNALAISKAPGNLYSAHMKLFEIAIEQGGQILKRYQKAVAKIFFIPVEEDETYKTTAINELQLAQAALRVEYAYLQRLLQSGSDLDIITSQVLTSESGLVSNHYWYQDDDMDYLGQRLKEYAVDYEKSFKSRLTKDIINALPKADALEEGKPMFISYNVGGAAVQNGGQHWLAILLVKHQGSVKICYKDSLGDFAENAVAVKEAFKQYYGESLYFIQHKTCEQEDGSSCGPMTINNLELMAKKIQEQGLDSFVAAFEYMQFTQQKEVAKLRSAHNEYLLGQQQNKVKRDSLLLSNLQSRYTCITTYLGNISTLLQQLGVQQPENEVQFEDKISDDPKHGLMLGTKVPNYLSKLKAEEYDAAMAKLRKEIAEFNDKQQEACIKKQDELKKLEALQQNTRDLKNAVKDSAVDELEYVGLNAVYQLKKIHDVPEEVIVNAQWQIGAGFATLAITIPFPFLLPVNGPIAGTLISEGISDIVMALIDQGNSEFDKKDYVKSKLIGYGISVATFGIGAIASSTKILAKAMNACRNLATKLRAVEGPFAKVCSWLANRLDGLANYLQKTIQKIEFASKTVAEQSQYLTQLKDAKNLSDFQQLQKLQKVSDVVMTHHQQLTSIVKTTVTGSLKSVAFSVAMEKIFTATLKQIMSGLKPFIERKVKETIKVRIEEKKEYLNTFCREDIEKSLQVLFDTNIAEDMAHVAKEISLGILRHASNWKAQLMTLAFEALLEGIDIGIYSGKICNKFFNSFKNIESKSTEEKLIEEQDNYQWLVEEMSSPVADMLYGKIVAITGKVIMTMPKALYKGYKEHQEKKADGVAIKAIEERMAAIEEADTAGRNAKCAHDAVGETLGIHSKQLADATGLGVSTQGASLEDVKKLYHNNNIKTEECDLKNAVKRISELDSDRAVVCLQRKEGVGHVVPVVLEKNQLVVKNGEQKISLDQFCSMSGYDLKAAKVVIPKKLNTANIEQHQHQVHRNRILKAGSLLMDYAGQNNGCGILYGTYGGSYRDLDARIPNRLGWIEINHMPPQDAYQNTPYANINPRNMPAIAMNIEDHRNSRGTSGAATSTGSSHVSQQYRNMLRQHMQNGEYWRALEMECRDVLNTRMGIDRMRHFYYRENVLSMLEYVRTTVIPGSPGGRPLITEQQYLWILQNLEPYLLRNINPDGNGLADYEFSSYWNQYSKKGIEELLSLRLKSIGAEKINVISPVYIWDDSQIIANKLINEIISNSNIPEEIILVPLNLYAKHWVGIIIEASEENINISYMDSEQNKMSSLLKEQLAKKLADIYHQFKINIKEIELELQKSNNCGPEVIENFIAYLTDGERLEQENAVAVHSLLLQDSLLLATEIGQKADIIAGNIEHHKSAESNVDQVRSDLKDSQRSPINDDILYRSASSLFFKNKANKLPKGYYAPFTEDTLMKI